MDQVDSGNRSAAPSGARPSLFAGGKSPTPDGPKQPEAISILSSLDKNGGKKPLGSTTGLPTWFTIAVGSLLGITIGAAIVMSFTGDANITRQAPAAPMLVARTAAPPQAPTPAAAAPAPGAPAMEIQAAATIENAPPAAAAPTPTASPQEAASDAGKRIGGMNSEPAAAAASEPATTKVLTAPAPSATETTPIPGGKASANANVDSRAEKSPPAKKARTKDNKTEVAGATATPADRDASLLAALVAYGEGRPATDINARAAPITNKSTDPKAGGTVTLAQAGGQFDPKRDVVLREPAVSTAELVRRCKMLGFFEGLLCRMRVCSNLWGKDAACPQSSAPVERGTP
jgi:hypothetical protein